MSILKGLEESVQGYPDMPRNARAHYPNIVEKMGYEKWRHSANSENRLKQIEKVVNELKRDVTFREKFDAILSPSATTIKQRRNFMQALQRKIQKKIEESKQKILNKLCNDIRMKKWWMKLVGWTEPINTAENSGTPTAEDRAFKKKLDALAVYVRLLSGKATASDENKKLYDYTMQKALKLLSKYHVIIINQVNK